MAILLWDLCAATFINRFSKQVKEGLHRGVPPFLPGKRSLVTVGDDVLSDARSAFTLHAR
jgi:hypothetical protein